MKISTLINALCCLCVLFNTTESNYIFCLQNESLSTLCKQAWFFADKTPTLTCNVDVLQKRFIKQNGTLVVQTLLGDQDYSRRNLNVRSEIRLLHKLLFKKQTKIFTDILIKDKDNSFVFLQVMSYVNNKATPIFQLEYLNGNFGARYNSGQQTLLRQALFPNTGGRRQFNLRMDADGIVINESTTIQFNTNLRKLIQNNYFWIQFGVYKNKKSNSIQKIHFYNLNIQQ